ncbi:MAG: IreB family regulatory phosphoprotein [Clostridia bacterium]|nr:IreB family regulatory phosphoprotein [Clostridia bacterium]
MLDNTGKTRTFSIASDKELEMFQIMSQVYASLKENGYDPINQLVGYILSEDPTYITNRNNARGLIRKIDRDELLRTLVKSYLGITED